MIEPSYKRDMNHNYLILKEEDVDRGEHFQERMVLENEIEGLLPVSIHVFNGEKELYYEISGKQTLQCLFEKKQMKAADLEVLLRGLEQAFSKMEAFFLDADYLLLSPEYIYLNLAQKQVSLCFCPFQKGNLQEKMETLAEYLLERIDHEENQAVVLAYQFYRLVKESNSTFLQMMEELFPAKVKEVYQKEEECENLYRSEEWMEQEMASTEQISLQEKEEFKSQKILYYLSVLAILAGTFYGAYGYFYCYLPADKAAGSFFATREFIGAATAGIIGVILWGFSFFFYRMQKRQEKEELVVQHCVDEVQMAEFKEETVIGLQQETEETSLYGEQTVLLSENCYEEERCLVSQDRRKEKIFMTEFPFVIGKMENMADYIVEDRSVSRMHARFLYDEKSDTVFLEDLNSANGTFKNGVRLEGNERVPVYAQDEIRFGRKVFIYQ